MTGGGGTGHAGSPPLVSNVSHMPMAENDKTAGCGISTHFRREAKMMAAIPWIVLALALLAAFLGPMLIHHFGGLFKLN